MRRLRSTGPDSAAWRRPKARICRVSPAARSDDWRISSRPFALRIARPQVAQQEAGVALDRGEQIVEVVRHAAGEAAEHLHLLRLSQLALQPLARRRCRGR